MKSLIHLNNVERAKLLADLFPSEIPVFLEFVKKVCAQITEDPEKLKKEWQENALISAEYWIAFAQHTATAIQQQGKQLHKSAAFANNLFEGLYASLLYHCIDQYSKRLPEKSKFRICCTLLFTD